MNVLVVHAHPDPQSFGAAVRDAALRGLHTAGHDVALVDLEAEGYEPCLTGAESSDPAVQAHIDAIRAADVLVFTYPTFWSGLPAVLKGWIDRTLVGDAGYSDRSSDMLRRELGHVRHVVGITTYGSPGPYRWLVGDAGRRTLRRVRWSIGPRCRFRWLSLDSLDGRTNDERSSFLVEVEQAMADVRSGRR